MIFILLSGVPGKPSKPTSEKITKTIFKIMWSPPPEGDSGFPVTGYILEKHESSQGQWVTEEQVSSSQRIASSHLWFESGGGGDFHTYCIRKREPTQMGFFT